MGRMLSMMNQFRLPFMMYDSVVGRDAEYAIHPSMSVPVASGASFPSDRTAVNCPLDHARDYPLVNSGSKRQSSIRTSSVSIERLVHVNFAKGVRKMSRDNLRKLHVKFVAASR